MIIMANQPKQSRDLADALFVATQSQFYGRGEAAAELNAAIAAREEKTARLREARLTKDRRDLIAATAAKLAKRSAKGRATSPCLFGGNGGRSRSFNLTA
jgi:hypothetical protein